MHVCQGYATGYCLRVVGQMAAFAVGGVFMMVQLAAYKGYIDVNWGKISGDTKKGLLDQVPRPFFHLLPVPRLSL